MSNNEQARAALATQPAESKACASVGEPKSNNQKEKKCTPTSADGTTQRNACLGIGGGPSSAITSSDTPTERELDLYDEIECDLPYLFGRAAFEGHASAQALADQVREKMKRARFLYATPPAAPAATEAPSVPFAYYIHIAADQRGEFVHDLDEALDDLTNCECKITELFDHPLAAVGASVQPAAGALPPVRWWSGVVGSPEKLANLLDGYSEKKESPRRDERVMRAAAKWIREVGASVQPVLASLSDEQRLDFLLAGDVLRFVEREPSGMWRVYHDIAKHGEACYAWRAMTMEFHPTARAAIDAALASSTPTKGGEAS